MKQNNEEWVSIREASTRLKLNYSKLVRLAQLGKISSDKNMEDERVKLVEIGEVKRYFKLP